MRRLALPIGALLTAALTAAPVPEPRLPAAWVKGWDRPVDPWGKCSFAGKGEKLIISLPGGSQPDARCGGLNTPRLLRDVDGDFVAEVRIGGNFLPPSERGCRKAGLLLTDGRNVVRFERYAGRGGRSGRLAYEIPCEGGHAEAFGIAGPGLERPAFLRIERRGDVISLAIREEGKEWVPADPPPPPPAGEALTYPRRLQVGVVVEATAEGTFRAEFDSFKLTLGKEF